MVSPLPPVAVVVTETILDLPKPTVPTTASRGLVDPWVRATLAEGKKKIS